MSELHKVVIEIIEYAPITSLDKAISIINLCMNLIIEEVSETRILDDPHADFLATDRMIAIAESLKEQGNE